ncbi:GTPase IMAP family member 7 [Austrofundulus limnaeus]|uniref:GTPase IMAP family member 7 n=1 Tax=Austrofundulus limnaeus TaxID=52670 RepID=A0A2I4ALH4_AUSLI|nr:PREDICTED: GTPase IMAP family member 7-like [Austrofundulus limnaeus]
MTEPKTIRIVFLGKSGAGKSSLANTIFRDEQFKVLHGFNSGTRVCEAKTKSVNRRKITLIDTPGFFDTHISEEKMKPEIVRCITECSPGPHAFLIVFKVEKFTEQEEAVIHKMTEYFSEDVFKYSTVVFTHGNALPKMKTIKDLVKQNEFVSHLVEKCGGRCHVIDNKHWNNHPKWTYRSNKFQVNEILKSIDKTVEVNNGNCYMNEMLQLTEELIQQEEKRIAETSENMSEEEIRAMAKNEVNKILIQAAGITVGALLGALFGVVLPVVLVAAGVTGGMKSAVGKAAAALTLGAGTIGAGGAGALAAGAKAVAAGAVAAGAEAIAAGAAVATGAEAVAAGAVAAGAAAAGAEVVAAGAVSAGAAAAGAEAVAGAGAVGAGAVGTAGVIGTGLTAGVAVVGVLAAVGAGFGGYEGHQAAQTAETPQEAAEKAAKAVGSKGLKAIKGAYNLELNKKLKKKRLTEKGSDT